MVPVPTVYTLRIIFARILHLNDDNIKITKHGTWQLAIYKNEVAVKYLKGVYQWEQFYKKLASEKCSNSAGSGSQQHCICSTAPQHWLALILCVPSLSLDEAMWHYCGEGEALLLPLWYLSIQDHVAQVSTFTSSDTFIRPGLLVCMTQYRYSSILLSLITSLFIFVKVLCFARQRC